MSSNEIQKKTSIRCPICGARLCDADPSRVWLVGSPYPPGRQSGIVFIKCVRCGKETGIALMRA